MARFREIPTNSKPRRAAEAPTWAVSCVGQWGPEILQQFTPEERGWVAAELHVTPGPYRDKYMRFQSGTATHGGGGAPSAEAQLKAERSFAGQVVRDDTMAESIFLALRRYPGRKVLHLDGNFHTAAFLGTAERLQLRDPRLRIAVIDPVEIDDPARPSFARERLADGTALQLIYPNPPAFADGEDSSEWVRKVTFVPLSADDRFNALQKKEIDLLSRNSSWTMGRETENSRARSISVGSLVPSG